MGISTSYDSPPPWGERAIPGIAFSRSPLPELGTVGLYVAWDTEGGCVRRAWHGCAAVGGRVANGRAGYAK